MDRRQRKTREAIFSAFIELLSKKDSNKITVGEIIERADVGRATFYAHFETKDFLQNELCEELFLHIFDSADGNALAHTHIFDCDAPDSVFLHLFSHIKKNDNNILQLLASQNNDLFLQYFKKGVCRLVESQIHLFQNEKSAQLPREFFINHISTTLVETVRWWIENGMTQTPQEITNYFTLAI